MLSVSFHSTHVSWLSCPSGGTSPPGFLVENVLHGLGQDWLQCWMFRVPKRVTPVFMVEKGLFQRLEESNARSGYHGRTQEGD